jgi:hypothetical protein
MITYVVQIGNSDDKLPQASYALFVDALSNLLVSLGVQIHFFGFSHPVAPWQNCCAVFEASDSRASMQDLRSGLAGLAKKFNQDSIALTGGITQFVEAGS